MPTFCQCDLCKKLGGENKLLNPVCIYCGAIGIKYYEQSVVMGICEKCKGFKGYGKEAKEQIQGEI